MLVGTVPRALHGVIQLHTQRLKLLLGGVGSGNTELQTISLAALTDVGVAETGGLDVYNNLLLDTLGMANLATVSGDTNVSNNLALCQDDVDAFFTQVDTAGTEVANGNNTTNCQ